VSAADVRASRFMPGITAARCHYSMPVDPSDADKYKVLVVVVSK